MMYQILFQKSVITLVTPDQSDPLLKFPVFPGSFRGRHRRRQEAVRQRVRARHHQVARLHHHISLQDLNPISILTKGSVCYDHH